jgi:uncharacterized membrane protein
MDYLLLALRLIHILGGIFWVGGALFMNFFIGPTVAATADVGQKFMGQLMTKAGVSGRLTAAAIATVLAGIALYWIDSNGFTSAWLSSGPGRGFGIGAFFALVGLGAGIMVGRNATALGQLGAQIQGKPNPEQVQKLQALQKRQAIIGPINVYSLILAAIFMAISRYLVF